MKKSILISLLVVLSLPMTACGWYGTDNVYLFRLYDGDEFSERVDKITRDNWKAYLGLDQDYYWFNADEVIKAAQQKGDALMVSYVKNLKRYLDVCSSVRDDSWNYPTKEDLAKRNQTLREVQAYALSKIKTKLRSQHALLYMRCNMVLGLNRENVEFWEKTASQFIETVYKDMMKNIYAGALYKTGKDAEAGELFAEMGDYNSLMTQFYKRRSFTAIRQEYQRNPNAGVLPFLLQDFVNNAQEAIDQDMEGKLFVRDIKEDEAMQMAQFAGQVVREGKTNNPAMWKAAQGWLEYLFGKKKQGYDDIQQALNMDGTEWAKTSARVIHFYIKSDVAPLNDAFDKWLTNELQWINGGEEPFGGFKGGALTRTINQQLVSKYDKAGRDFTTNALLNVTNNYAFETRLNSMKVERLEDFFTYTKSPSDNELDEYLKSQMKISPTQMYELIGTKHLRVCQWEQAINWLQQVPVSYMAEQTQVVYAVNRTWTIEPWITRQWLSDEVEYSNEKLKLKSNYKLDFAKEMLAMEKEAAILKGQAQCQRYYDLAIRYAQASYSGDCWYLTRYSKSWTDSVEVNEANFAAIAKELLIKASDTKDPVLKEKALFGNCYYYLNEGGWYEEFWNDQLNKFDHRVLPQSKQYQALKTLADYEHSRGTTSAFVSNCDVYTTFLSAYKR